MAPAAAPPLGPSGTESQYLPDKPLRLVSANLWLLPPPIPIRQDERLALFVDLVRRRSPDLLVLQEVWLFSHLERLRRDLPDYWTTFPRWDLFNHTGLVVFSRVSPVEADWGRFGPSPRHNLQELLADKGFLRLVFPTRVGRIVVIDTHLYSAGYNPDERTVTDAQFRALRAVVASATDPVVVAGDLNTHGPLLCPLNDGMFELEADLETRTQVTGEGRKIDHVLRRGTATVGLRLDVEVITDPVVSDHFPLEASLTLRVEEAGGGGAVSGGR